MPNVVKVQAGYKVQPLSAYLHQPAPPAAPSIDFPKIDKQMVKTGFFQYLDFALQFIPAAPEEVAIRAKLASIGIGPGKTFDFKDFSPEHKAAVLLGMKEGDSKIDQAIANTGKNINGWRVGGLAGGDRASFAGDWLKRAAVAKAGIYANDPVEATYPLTRTDSAGEILDGNKHDYTFTFAQGQFPPVNAFWSVTIPIQSFICGGLRCSKAADRDCRQCWSGCQAETAPSGGLGRVAYGALTYRRCGGIQEKRL
jgi:hypothetical protein